MKEYSYEMSKYLPDDCIIRAYYSSQINTNKKIGKAKDLVRCGLTSFKIVDDRFSNYSRDTGESWYDNFEKPPVGEICEAYVDDEWQQVKIIQHDGENVVFSVDGRDGVEYRTLGSLLLYRPESKDLFTSLHDMLGQEGVENVDILANKINKLVKRYY
ncbi:MAG: hypothetical protein GOVbin4162_106 [Prokaryotic dsDNA virus sp.]|nr:MAG: hypothetical protein GOVbin4162_106 [Prokaryotic dsDNA virus sp.]|tara:strand:- start:4064 stop:4537 length:474 start_codon:yes stop_codon:yes gene_type:complete